MRFDGTKQPRIYFTGSVAILVIILPTKNKDTHFKFCLREFHMWHDSRRWSEDCDSIHERERKGAEWNEDLALCWLAMSCRWLWKRGEECQGIKLAMALSSCLARERGVQNCSGVLSQISSLFSLLYADKNPTETPRNVEFNDQFQILVIGTMFFVPILIRTNF